MPNYNKTIIAGHLARDPEMRYLPSQMAVANFAIAVNHNYKTKQGEERKEVTFIDCTAFGKTGEIINQYCAKGKALLVEGRLKQETWEDKNGGGKRSKIVLIVEEFQFLGGKGDGDGQTEPQQATARRTEPQQAARQPDPPAEPDVELFSADDIPF